jgi:hypothetical protein
VVEQLHRYRAIGERAGGGHQEVRLVDQFDVLDVASDPAVVEQQVEIPDLRIFRFHLVQPDVAAWVLVQQPAHDRRQDQVGDALEGGDVDPAATRVEPVDGVGQRLCLREQIAPVGQDHLAEGSDPYRPGTSRPVEDGATDGLLQPGDLLAHRRLGVAEPNRRSPERSFLGDGGHGPQMAQLDVGHSARD